MAELKDLIVYGPSNLIGESFTDIIHANKFMTNGGTSSQFVKGDGTLDSNVYITAAQVSNDKVKQEATATGTDKYPLLLKYTTTYNATDNGNYTRFSSVASGSASILSATPAGDLYSKSLTTTAAISAGSTITAATSITATNGDIVCTGSGKYFKGLLAPNATAASAYIYTYANQPLSGNSSQSSWLTEDTKPASVKNIVNLIDSKISDISDDYLPLAGGTMTGDISMGELNNITDLADGVNAKDAVNVGQTIVIDSGDTNLNYSANSKKIKDVATPTAGTDAANKAYVDSRVSFPTIATQDTQQNQIDGSKDFNVAYVDVETPQSSGNKYLNFTTKMQSGTICHILIHSSDSSSTEPKIMNYSSTPINVFIPSTIRVWNDSAATSNDYEGVWINGEQMMFDSTTHQTGNTYENTGKRFQIPANGFVEISVMYTSEEYEVTKGSTTTRGIVNRTMIKVDAPVYSYNDSPLD